MSYWHDKVALITGGSRGLGMALSRTLVERDVSVVIVARDGEALNRAVKGLQGKGDGKIEGQVADVTVTEDVERAVAYTVERFGRLDLLINCAGRSTRGRILDTPPDVFQALWDLNFLGTVRCTQACAPHLLQSQGHLVNIGSLASRAVSRYLGAYPATKSALAAYTQQLRLELGPKGVHVLLVCPGPIDRDDAGQRYADQASDLPETARRPGAGVNLRTLDPNELAQKILTACERRRPELVLPAKARLLFALSSLSPRLGDWLVRRFTREF